MPVFGPPPPMDELENQPVQLQFRDGAKWVPAHLAKMMEGLETYKLTYDQAKREANNQATRDFTLNELDKVVQRHFRRTP